MGEQREEVGGVTTDGGVVRLDIDAVRTLHDVNDDDPNCRTCATPYPCPLLDIAEQLDEWIQSQPQTPVPDGTGDEKE